MAQKKKSRVGAEDLGISLKSQRGPELFSWLVACLLFAKPVDQEMAGGAFLALEREHLTTPAAIRKAGWRRLVKVLDDAHYVRYDESTATRLLQAVELLKERYGGSMRRLVKQSGDRAELSRRLQEFSGIGPKASRLYISALAGAGWHAA